MRESALPKSQPAHTWAFLLATTPEEGRVKAALFVCVPKGIKTRWRSSRRLFPSLASRVHRFALLIGLGILLRCLLARLATRSVGGAVATGADRVG
jgi:hypothetical protein